MGKTAFLYAGQGSQQTGMGQQLYAIFPEFRDIIDSTCFGFDVKKACFENPNDILKQTRYTQPALVAFACGVTEILKNKKIIPDYVCGLSLGEYSALYAAGVWPFQETMRIVSYRGVAMEEASKGIESAMTAIIGLGLEEVEECCNEAKKTGIVSVCNLNCPGQIVIGGEKEAVAQATSLAHEHGARRCLRLPVSGPFHTELMSPAAEALKTLFEETIFETPKMTVVHNVLGGPNIDNYDISDLLVRQVKSTVKMQNCIEYLFKEGVERFIEIGPGKTLQGFVKKTGDFMNITQNNYSTVSINNADDISMTMRI